MRYIWEPSLKAEFEKGTYQKGFLWRTLCIKVMIYAWHGLKPIIIAFFGVCTKLSNHILQYSDVKFMHEIEPLQIDFLSLQYSKVLFHGLIDFFNHICIAITFYDKCKKSKNNILQWCNLKIYAQNQDIKPSKNKI